MAEVLGTDPGKGILGMKTTLAGATTGPVGMITKIGIVGQEADEVEITTMNSPDNYKEFIAGLIDAKSLSLNLLYERVNMGILLPRVGQPNEIWTIVFPDTSTFVVTGHIKQIGTEIDMKDKIMQTCTIRLSGPPAFHAASGA